MLSLAGCILGSQMYKRHQRIYSKSSDQPRHDSSLIHPRISPLTVQRTVDIPFHFAKVTGGAAAWTKDLPGPVVAPASGAARPFPPPSPTPAVGGRIAGRAKRVDQGGVATTLPRHELARSAVTRRSTMASKTHCKWPGIRSVGGDPNGGTQRGQWNGTRKVAQISTRRSVTPTHSP